jgi:hypothetical protein
LFSSVPFGLFFFGGVEMGEKADDWFILIEEDVNDEVDDEVDEGGVIDGLFVAVFIEVVLDVFSYFFGNSENSLLGSCLAVVKSGFVSNIDLLHKSNSR